MVHEEAPEPEYEPAAQLTQVPELVAPVAAQTYLRRFEALVGAPIALVSTGPDREETIVLQRPFD